MTDLRPRRVIEHILEHGAVTTEELRDHYGYNHPPRAAQDVKDRGIPLRTTMVNSSSGRKIAAYTFDDDPKKFRELSGRAAFTKELKKELLKMYGSRCAVALQDIEPASLQIDHRIPYLVAGDSEATAPEDYMLLSGSANRQKSWACEHCKNGISIKDADICRSCYWAYPENYKHVAMAQIRRLDLLWTGNEVTEFDRLDERAKGAGTSLQDLIKQRLRQGS